MLRSQVVEHLAHDTYAFVFPNSGSHITVKLLVSSVDHHAGGVEQGDLVLSFDFPDLVHQLLTVYDLDSLGLQGEKHGEFDDVDSHRLVEQTALFSSTRILRATSSARPDEGLVAPRRVEMPARERSPSQGQ